MEDPMGKNKPQDNPFIELPAQQHTVVDMKGKTANQLTNSSEFSEAIKLTSIISFLRRCNGAERHNRASCRSPE